MREADMTEFYDSISGQWPAGAQYAALYFDSSLNDGFQPQKSTIPNQRWITRRGGAAAAANTGIADYEQGNLVYEGDLLAGWAEARQAAGYRSRTYCNVSDVHHAFPQVGGLPGNVWWIATLDNDPRWTPDKITARIRAVTGIAIAPEAIWGIQWGTNNRYDTSTLFGEW